MTHTNTISSAAGNSTVDYLREAGVTVEGDRSGFVVIFDDLDVALAGVKKASAMAFASYLRAGGNPRNKRSISTQFAAVTKALRAAA